MEAIGRVGYGIFSKLVKVELIDDTLTISRLKSGKIEFQAKISEITVTHYFPRNDVVSGVLNLSKNSENYVVIWHDKRQDHAFHSIHNSLGHK